MFKEIALSTIGSFRAVEMWMHAAHHLTKGPSFIANHELLYGRIYQAASKDFDTIVEKFLYQVNDEEWTENGKVEDDSEAEDEDKTLEGDGMLEDGGEIDEV